MVVAYYWRRQTADTKELMDSAAGLIRSELNELKRQVESEYQEISKVVHGENWHRMSTIREEESDEDDSDTSIGIFNRLIGGMKAVARKAGESFTIYK